MKNKHLILAIVILIVILFPVANAFANGLPKIDITHRKMQKSRIVDESIHDIIVSYIVSIPKNLTAGLLSEVNSDLLNSSNKLKNAVVTNLIVNLKIRRKSKF